MWRWIHSLPRAVRQQCHGPGASAGVCVEDRQKEFKEKEKKKKKDACRWKFHCRKRDQRKNANKTNEENRGSGTKTCNDFWKSIRGQHKPLECVGLGGAVAIGVQLHVGNHRINNERRKLQLDAARSRCLWPTMVQTAVPSTLHCIQPRTTVSARQYHSSAAQWATLKQEKTTEKQTSKPEVLEKSAGKEHESIETVFQDFKTICRNYTSTGKGIEANQAAESGQVAAAVSLWKESSQLGNTKSKFNLAVCYETGMGVNKDLSEAVKLYRSAAADLHPQSMFNLGVMYMDGTDHTPQNKARGVDLIIAAADFGLPEAQRYLGVYYTEEATEDLDKSVKYLAMAASQNDAEAQYLMGLCYEHGLGVEENTCKATDMFTKAAESNHADAYYSLAVYHREGLGGLPQDIQCADRLMKTALELGSEDAINELTGESTQHREMTHTNISTQNKKDSDHIWEKSNVAETILHEDNTLPKKITENPDQDKIYSPLDLDELSLYMFRLSSCVSSPCLTELLRQGLNARGSDSTPSTQPEPAVKPASHYGPSSQLYNQLVAPRGYTSPPRRTNLSRSSSPSSLDSSSDSGIVFRLDAEVDEDLVSSPIGSVSGDSACSVMHRTHTMPELSHIA